jgi:hypothetical protein
VGSLPLSLSLSGGGERKEGRWGCVRVPLFLSRDDEERETHGKLQEVLLLSLPSRQGDRIRFLPLIFTTNHIF